MGDSERNFATDVDYGIFPSGGVEKTTGEYPRVWLRHFLFDFGATLLFKGNDNELDSSRGFSRTESLLIR